MSITYTAFATSAASTLADEGITVYRNETGDGGNVVLDQQGVATWTADGEGISDADGDLDIDLAEARLAAMGWQVTGAGWVPSGGQWAIEVEPAR